MSLSTVVRVIAECDRCGRVATVDGVQAQWESAGTAISDGAGSARRRSVVFRVWPAGGGRPRRPVLTDVDDDDLFSDPHALGPDPHRRTQQRVAVVDMGHRVLAGLERHHRGVDRHHPGGSERDCVRHRREGLRQADGQGLV